MTKKYLLTFFSILFCSSLWAKPSKRLFDYDFSVGAQVKMPESKVSSVNLSESMVHKPVLNSSQTVLDIQDDFMGNFPELIKHISSALNEIKTPETTTLNTIEIKSSRAFEAKTPDLKIFDKNQ